MLFCAAFLLSAAIGQQSGLLPQRHDPTRSALDRRFVCRPRDPVITPKGDQLLDVGVRVVPLLNHGRSNWCPVAIRLLKNKHGTPSSGTKPVNRFRVYPKTTMEAKMADRDVFGRSAREDRTLPSGLHPIISIVGFLLIAALFHRDKSADFIKVDPANVQIPSTQ